MMASDPFFVIFRISHKIQLFYIFICASGVEYATVVEISTIEKYEESAFQRTLKVP